MSGFGENTIVKSPILRRLKEARHTAKLTSADVVTHLPDIHSPSSLSQWESGNRRLTVERLIQLCEIYDADVLWVLTGQPSDCPDLRQKIARAEEHIRHLMELIEG